MQPSKTAAQRYTGARYSGKKEVSYADVYPELNNGGLFQLLGLLNTLLVHKAKVLLSKVKLSR